MKLLNKTNLYYLSGALIIFAAGTLVFYFMLMKIMNNEASEQLQIEKDRICHKLDALGTVPDQFISFGDEVQIKQIPYTKNASSATVPMDTTMFSKEMNEDLPYRKLNFIYNSPNTQQTSYSITLLKPFFESDDVITAIVKAMLILLALLLLCMFEINRRISRKLWKPFYHALHLLDSYNLAKASPLTFEKSGINEFDELNEALAKMTDKISGDYLSLKDFSENASHEIQTPLAIMKAKLELLMQSEGMNEQQKKLITEVYESLNRLSRLNQALVLLTRIGNNQFGDLKMISMNDLLQNKLTSFEEMLQHKNIQVEKDLTVRVDGMINPGLADILMSNLLGNAIKHNQKGGKLILKTAPGEIRLMNTGEPLQGNPARLFERFHKEKPASDSLGLGLAIVRQICDSSGIEIRYLYADDLHQISLKFTA
ncbi:MAG TPA: HAMP domain-containing sensor histidine kinase [Bacteroidia bacterium]|nr:HAMP domain-containing sensor histidine kinase [Bacteroidia bacterium]